MKRYSIITILAFAVLSVSCENTIRYEYALNDGKITIMAQLCASDIQHSVFLSMSYPDRIDSLSGATVNCYVNGVLHRATQVHPGYEEYIDWDTQETVIAPIKNRYTRYDFQAEFKPGDKVRIEALKGGAEAWAEEVVPQPGRLVSVDTATVVKSFVFQNLDGSETYEQEYVEFTIRLDDVRGSDSFFTMDGMMTTVTQLTSAGEGENRVVVEGPYRLDYETFHDLILEDGYSSGLGELFEDLMPVNSTHCFSDKSFQDGEAVVRLYIPSYYFKSYPYYYDADRIEVNKFFRLSFKSIDRGFYNYLRALNNMLCYGFDVSPIIEPTMLPSNVNDGMGMVSIASESDYELVLDKQVFYREDFIYY